jgi:hypothetical protein
LKTETGMTRGGCFCGAIRYEFGAGDYRVVNCHCTMCRRTSGAPFVTWVVVPRASFRYVAGSPRQLRSSERGTREFCRDCGTPLVFFESGRPDQLDVTVGSLDEPARFPPAAAVHTDTRLGWLDHVE